MAKTPKTTSKVQRQNPLINRPIAHAYALIPDPDKPGRFFALHLTDVIAGGVEHLEPSSRSTIAAYGLQRIERAMEARHRRRAWGEPKDEPPNEAAPPAQEAAP